MTRLLVTGSRRWTDQVLMDDVLYPWFLGDQETVLVHGGAVGADIMAGLSWSGWGGAVEVHRADWSGLGRAAGPVRNQAMVDLGADVVMAFLLPDSVGTKDCVSRARAAGIKVYEFNRAH